MSVRPPPSMTVAPAGGSIGASEIVAIVLPLTSTLEGAERALLTPSKMRTSRNSTPSAGDGVVTAAATGVAPTCARTGMRYAAAIRPAARLALTRLRRLARCCGTTGSAWGSAEVDSVGFTVLLPCLGRHLSQPASTPPGLHKYGRLTPVLCSSVRVHGDGLRTVEDIVGVVISLHPLESWQVGSVVRAFPVGEVGVDVIDVGATGVRRHCRAQVADPGEGRRFRGVIPPVSLILQVEERAAMGKRRCRWIYPRDSPAQRKEPHQIRREGRGAQMTHQ